MKDFTVNIEVTIKDKRVEDLLITAFEGGSNYWYYDLAPHYPMGETKESLGIEFWHGELPLVPGGYLTLKVNDYGEENQEYYINRGTIQRGLEIMAVQYPRHFTDFMQDNEDADTADVFLQCVCFGDVIFG